MNKKTKHALLGLVTLMSILSCNKQSAPEKEDKIDYSKVDPLNIAFTSDDIIQQSFGGLGVEWGAYEDTDKIAEGGWERIIKNMDHLGPARIRLMINYDWFCQNFDNKGNTDPNDDTWTYNFNNKYARNMIEILEYCQVHAIDVAFGCWNVIGDFQDDPWKMMEKVTSDIRWAKISADVLNFLVNQKGFSCIKWFVNSNEPNYAGREGSSKNYNNTYYIWEQGVKNVRAALDEVGLEYIGIVGGDTTGYEGTDEYFTNIAKRIPDLVGDYGAHLYLSNIEIDKGIMYEYIDEIYKKVKKIDKGLGIVRDADIWEAGLLDGKTALDSQALIATANYAIRMTDYTLQCLAGGVNGIVYWDFDDAMHFMYAANATFAKKWGMFSSLSDARSGEQELRPWYHTSSLMCHLFKKGNKIYSPLQNSPQVDNTFRSIATINQDGTQGGFVCTNSSGKAVTKTFYVDDLVAGDQLYIYRFAENTYCIGADGFIEPNEIITGSLNKKITLTLPAHSAYVVSNQRL